MTSIPYKEDCPDFFEFSNQEKKTKIWRYMDLAKFISLLELKELYFNRGDCFEDKLEGSYSEPTIQELDKNIRGVLLLGDIQISEYEVRNLVSLINQINRLCVFISCWHMNQHESYAMWDLYSKDGKGIAIQSTINRVEASLDTNSNGQNVYIIPGKVHYLDFSSEEFKVVPIEIRGLQSSNFSILIKAMYAFLHKRYSFEHEKEIRFFSDQSCKLDLPLPKKQLIQGAGQASDHSLKAALEMWEKILTKKLEELKNAPTGMKIKIKPGCMNELIEQVYISPRAPKWFNESLVRGIVNRYSLYCTVKKSDLNKDPLL